MLLDVRMNRRTVLIPVIAGAVVLAGAGGGSCGSSSGGSPSRTARPGPRPTPSPGVVGPRPGPGRYVVQRDVRGAGRAVVHHGDRGAGQRARGGQGGSVNRSGDTGRRSSTSAGRCPAARRGPTPSRSAQAHRQPVEPSSRPVPVPLAPEGARHQALTAARTWAGVARPGPERQPLLASAPSTTCRSTRRGRHRPPSARSRRSSTSRPGHLTPSWRRPRGPGPAHRSR